VLDDAGQPIQLPDGDVSVASDGTISVNGEAVATLGIGVFADPAAELQHTEGNLFTGPADSTGEDQPRVVQGYLETSNANPSQLMTQLVEVARSMSYWEKPSHRLDESDKIRSFHAILSSSYFEHYPPGYPQPAGGFGCDQ
jgi:flagellar basal body rod protein FlgG